MGHFPFPRRSATPLARAALIVATAAGCARGADASRAPDSGRAAPDSAVAVDPAVAPTLPDARPRVADLQFIDVNGRAGKLSDFGGKRAVIIAMRDLGCPISQKYAPRLAEIDREFAAKGIAFVYVDVNPADSRDAMKKEIARFGFSGPYVFDSTETLSRALGASSTAEVFVLDPERVVVYQGAIDDQYGLGFTRPQIGRSYLRDALDAVLAGREVPVRSTAAPGCLLGGKSVAAVPPAITYHNRVSRIIQNNCQTCHRTGGIAPFAMERYVDAYGKRETIALMVRTGRMPPWFAHKDVGEWANDRSLSAQDREDLLAWIAEGAVEGDSTDAPPAKQWVEGWNIGTPDTVLRIPDAQSVPAQGYVDYRYVYVKTDFPEDRWVQAMEVRPTAPKVVHHVLVFIEDSANGPPQPGQRRVFQGGLDGYFAANVPGYYGLTFPKGMAKRIPKGATLKFQLHYTPNGVATVDQTMIGLVFADSAPTRPVETSAAANVRFLIPPGAPKHEVTAIYTFRQAGSLIAFFPHMHLRGAAFRYDLLLPDGREVPLLDVPRYDFNWQMQYTLKEPIEVPAGARIRATAWYDNSAANPFNPDPTKAVRFGEQTYEEMMIGYFDWYAR